MPVPGQVEARLENTCLAINFVVPHNEIVRIALRNFCFFLLPILFIGCPRPNHAPAPRLEGPNVIIVVVDTLGAYDLGFMGYDRDTCPFLNELAQKCIVFDRAYAPKAQTLPSFTSLWSGLHPVTHNIQDNGVVVPDSIHFLVEDFRDAGYQTVGVAAGGVLARKYKPDKGFSTYFDCTAHDIKAPEVLDKVRGYLEGAGEAGKPTYDPDNGRLFLFVHFFDPHTDYEPDPQILAQFADPNYSGPVDGTLDVFGAYNRYEIEFNEADLQHTEDLYDAEIRTLDDYLRELFDIFERNGLTDNSIIVFTGDHGEDLGEHHYITHGHPYERGLHIPLLFYLPDEKSAGTRVKTLIEIQDVLPTLMDMLDIPVPDGIDGMSYRKVLENPDAATEEDSREFVLSCGGFNNEEKRTYSLFDGHYRLIRDIRWSDEPLLYDIRVDPLEKNNIAGEHPDVVELQSAIIDILSEGAGPVEHPEYDPETYEMLKSLGYVS
jgi:arylsulfatase A-like enzyme